VKDETCCQKSSPIAKDNPKNRRLRRRFFELAKLAMPAALLALLPKCPLCFAAYFAGLTGFGLSIAAAGYLRWTLVALCGGAISYLIVKHLRANRNQLIGR
jgi:hypothetical protein